MDVFPLLHEAKLRVGIYEAGERLGDGPLLTQEENLCALEVI